MDRLPRGLPPPPASEDRFSGILAVYSLSLFFVVDFVWDMGGGPSILLYENSSVVNHTANSLARAGRSNYPRAKQPIETSLRRLKATEMC